MEGKRKISRTVRCNEIYNGKEVVLLNNGRYSFLHIKRQTSGIERRANKLSFE